MENIDINAIKKTIQDIIAKPDPSQFDGNFLEALTSIAIGKDGYVQGFWNENVSNLKNDLSDEKIHLGIRSYILERMISNPREEQPLTIEALFKRITKYNESVKLDKQKITMLDLLYYYIP